MTMLRDKAPLLDELPAELRTLVDELRRDGPVGPPPHRRERLRQRLMASIGALPLPPVSPPPVPGQPWTATGAKASATLSAGTALKTMMATVAIVGGVAGTVTLVRHQTRPPLSQRAAIPSDSATPQTVVETKGMDSKSSVEPTSARSTASATAKRVTGRQTSAGIAISRRRSTHERRPAASPRHGGTATTSSAEEATPRSATQAPPAHATEDASSTLGRERQLLAEAWLALREHHPERALNLVHEHQRLVVAGGILDEERDVIEIRALFSLGRAEAGRRAARIFHQRYPNSLSWPRIEALLQSVERTR